MAEPSSDYLPPLDRCLEGNVQLISWTAAFVRLVTNDPQDLRDTAIERFLSNKQTSQLLVRPFGAFRPTPQANSAFVSGTAAIYVTPTSTAKTDAEQLKDDALWLSKHAKIDELSALRIAIIEWQSRPAAQLLSGAAEDEPALETVTGPNALGASLFLPKMSTGPTGPNFQIASSRRARLLKLYLSERRHFLKVTEQLVRAGLAASPSRNVEGKGKGKDTTVWTESIGKTILNARCSGDDSETGTESFLVECIDGLNSRAEDLLASTSSSLEERDETSIESDWQRCLLLEMIHIVQLVFSLVDCTQAVPSSKVALTWFRFGAQYQFFDATELAAHLSVTQPAFLSYLQALMSTVSLAVLKLPLTLALLLQDDEHPVDRSPTFKGPYIADVSAVSEIHSVFIHTTEHIAAVASPAVFAWSIILQTMRDVDARDRDGEDRQSQRLLGSHGDPDSSATEEGESSATENGTGRGAMKRPSKSTTFIGEVGVAEILKALGRSSPLDETVQALAKSAAEGNRVYDVILNISTEHCKVFSAPGHGQAGQRMRIVLLELIQASLEWVQYSPDVVGATLGILTGGEDSWPIAEPLDPVRDLDPAAMFVEDDLELVPKILDMAHARFPLEVQPLLRLVRTLQAISKLDDDGLPFAASVIDDMRTLTLALPDDFQGLDTLREDENVGQLVLRAELGVLAPRKRVGLVSTRFSDRLALVSASGNYGDGNGLVIPPGTEGLFSTATPGIVQWRFQYSGLQYLGMLLESLLPNGSLVDCLGHADVPSDLTAEIIGLLATLLASTHRIRSRESASEATEAAQLLLGRASDGLGRNADIVAVILEHLEKELQDSPDATGVAGSMDVLVSCTQFLHALAPILPGRVWPYFARSSLLGLDGHGGRLGDLIARTEIVTGRFEFMIGCIRMFEALVDEAIDHAIARTSGSDSIARPSVVDTLGIGISEQVMGKVLLIFEQTLLDVFRSYPNWKFVLLEQRLETGTRILKVFNHILLRAHGIDNSSQQDRKFLDMIVPAANYLVDVFLSSVPSNLPIDSLLQILADAADTPFSTLFSGTTLSWVQQTLSALEFCNTLVRVNSLLGRPRSFLEKRLFDASPLLIRIFSSVQTYRQPVVALLDAMIGSAALEKAEPPSLLGRLGPTSAKYFIGLISQFGEPIGDEALDIAIWNLMSTMLGSRQQWFAVHLLTGSAPRESAKAAAAGQARPDGPASGGRVLALALDQLVELDKLPCSKVWAMLEFVVLAGDYWPWTVPEIKRHDKFLSSALDFLSVLHTRVDLKKASKARDACDAIRTASLICEILAICLHYSQQLGDSSLARKLLPKITYLLDEGVAVRAYNESLHANLKRNFEARFSGCTLSMFRRTKLRRVDFGEKYFYDIDLAERMLAYDASWHGVGGNGLAEDVARANVNLSLVESQVLLLYSWRALVLELSQSSLAEPDLQGPIAKVVNACLENNRDRNLPEEIFDQLLRARSDMAFVLMQRLAEAKATGPEMKRLLYTTWDTIKYSDVNFELALVNGDVEYYRFLLRILFLSLQPHLSETVVSSDSLRSSGGSHKAAIPTLSRLQQIILDVLDIVVARGFRHLTAAAHESSGKSSPEDIALVTAILQISLRIPSIEIMQPQICTRFMDQETARVATTLYSWSDKLAVDGDPIYGELALLFLVDLSRIPLMAEQLAVDGVLSQLSNANLTALLREGVRPLGRHRRLYTIWVRGFVPLCLNLLQAVGPVIAPEVSSFLGQFKKQLAISSNAFEDKPQPALTSTTTLANLPAGTFFTLTMASEAHSLALVHRILETFRAAGSSTGVPASEILLLEWDAAGLKEDIEYWLSRRGALRDRLLPVSVAEEDMAREKIPTAHHQQHRKDGIVASEDRFEEKFVAELNAVVGLLSPD